MIHPKYKLPNGLPACIAHGKSGLRVLQDLLGISNRKEWQSILHSEAVKDYLQSESLQLRGLTSSQRVASKVIAFYSRTDARREFWGWHCPLGPGIAPVSDPQSIPSIEYEAFRRYDPRFAEQDIDIARIERSFEGVIGFRHSGRLPHLEEPALALWPALREDILRWSSLPSDRQEAVVLATFSVASILDDPRVLAWSGRQDARLAEEFAFALKTSPEESSEPEESARGDGLGSSSGSERVLEEWNRSCDLIMDIAADLKSSSPDPDRLSELLQPVKRLEDLRAQILNLIDLRERAALVSRVTDILTKCADDHSAPWLSAVRDSVHAQWLLAYRDPATVPEDAVNKDLERVQAELSRQLQQWRDSEGAKADLRDELSGLQVSLESGLEAQLEAEAREERLHAGIAEAARQASSCKRAILAAIGPAGQEFDPSRDYEAELAEADAIPALPQAPGPSNGDEPDARLGQGTEAPSPSGGSAPTHGTDGANQDSARESESGPDPETDPVPAAAPKTDLGLGDSSSGRLADQQAHAVSETESAPTAIAATAEDRFWDDEWEPWLEHIGDPTNPDSVKPWNPAGVPDCPATSPFADPSGFAESLARKLRNGLVECPRDSLFALVEFLNSDPMKGRQEWKVIYWEILNYCLREDLDAKDSQAMALALISLILRTKPSNIEYKRLVDSADRLTALPPQFQNVKWALELSVPFLVHRCEDLDYLSVYLESVHQYVSMSGFHFASKHEAMWSNVKGFLASNSDDAARRSLGSEFAQEQRKLCSFLKGKSVVIYTLQRSAALTVRDRIQAIESSTKIRLLHDKVWSDTLQDPIRNADLCVMVKSAATHAVTEMISRTRRNAGKELIVPSWKGVHSLLRAIFEAAKTSDSSGVAGGLQGADGMA